jgi:hypothetical protein
MSWADACIAKLRLGQIAQCRPHGGSMRGRIESGQLVTLDPAREPNVDDAVLCRCRGNIYVHLVKAVRGHGEDRQFLIGNNLGGTNGWISRAAIHAVVIAVSD